MNDNFCLVYRTGGTDNFKWHRSSAMSKKVAVEAKKNNERMGYKTLIVGYKHSVSIGLPETYEY